LLEGESHARALRALDEFIDRHGETLIEDPLKRAVLQRDLWALFDWAATRNRRSRAPFYPEEAQALTARLATIIRRVALTKEQIDSFPDNYALAIAAKAFPTAFDATKPDDAFLPADLFTKDGPWVCVEVDVGLPAPVHTREFGGRSVFLVFIRLPRGRVETLAYLDKLNQFPEPWIFDKASMEEMQRKDPAIFLAAMPHRFDSKSGPWVNPGMPQFPDGTEFALVRRAVLIDTEGQLVPSRLTESVQLRVYRGIDRSRGAVSKQSVMEFDFSRPALFAGTAGGLQAVHEKDKDFSVFLVIGIDPFEFQLSANPRPPDPEGGPALRRCMSCHDGAGIFSVLSHSQLFSGKTLRPPSYRQSDAESIEESTASWKNDQFSLGLLRGLWQRETTP
jgi:hypothetical protein